MYAQLMLDAASKDSHVIMLLIVQKACPETSVRTLVSGHSLHGAVYLLLYASTSTNLGGTRRWQSQNTPGVQIW